MKVLHQWKFLQKLPAEDNSKQIVYAYLNDEST